MLVGNKMDIEDRQVMYEEGKNLALCYGVPFIETSALTDTNIKELFRTIGKEIKDKIIFT